MKPTVGIVLATFALTSVRAGSPLAGVHPRDDSDDASASGSWDFSWDESGSTEASRSGYSCNSICPTDYEPVCGSDGVTYANDCAFSNAQCHMKVLTLTAVGECAGGSEASSAEAGSDAATCPDTCLDVYDPVSDESGKTFSNECYLRMEKCKGTKKDVDILEEYKKLYGRSFGASRDGSEEDGSSSTATKAPTRVMKKLSKTVKASSTSSSAGRLNEDGSSGVIGNDGSASNCAGACPDIYSPVCGSDGITYSSACHLELASCKNPKSKIVQAGEDVCADSAATTRQQQNATKSTKTTTP